MGVLPPEERGSGVAQTKWVAKQFSDKGPWEGLSVCAACHHELSDHDHLSNKCVCPHCGSCSATGTGRQGLGVVTRRKVFLNPVRGQVWWWRLLRILRRPRKFVWETKEHVVCEES